LGVICEGRTRKYRDNTGHNIQVKSPTLGGLFLPVGIGEGEKRRMEEASKLPSHCKKLPLIRYQDVLSKGGGKTRITELHIHRAFEGILSAQDAGDN